MSYSEQEKANIALINEYRSVPMEERGRFFAPHVRTGRDGFHNLGNITGQRDLSPDAIPDRDDEVIGIVAHGDEVWALWVVRGTHRGDLLGIPATGRELAVLEMGRWRIEDGKIVEGWFMADELGLVDQLGFRMVAAE